MLESIMKRTSAGNVTVALPAGISRPRSAACRRSGRRSGPPVSPRRVRRRAPRTRSTRRKGRSTSGGASSAACARKHAAAGNPVLAGSPSPVRQAGTPCAWRTGISPPDGLPGHPVPPRPVAAPAGSVRRRLQRLRPRSAGARKPCIRSAAVRDRLRRISPARGWAAGNRPRVEEHAGGPCQDVRGDRGAPDRHRDRRMRRKRRIFRDSYAVENGVGAVLPVDLFIPGARLTR